VTNEGGLLLVDKRAEVSSHDVVLAARRELKLKRIGHTGTLDPFATGLLLLLVGPATRLAELFHVLPKTYVATMALGIETDTDDLTGKITDESEGWRDLDAERVASALRSYLGSSLQVPATYSAKRIGGKRAHRLARAGGAVELAGSPVTVHDIGLQALDGPNVRFRACVSTGTYIRALARDVGRDLGCGAHLVDLRRTAIGPFVVGDAVASDRISPEALRSKATSRSGSSILPWLRHRRLTSEDLFAVQQGRPIDPGDLLPPEWSDWGADRAGEAPAGDERPRGELVALTDAVRLLAVAELDGQALRPRKVFPT